MKVTAPIPCPGTVPVVTDTGPHPSHTQLPAYVVMPPVRTETVATSTGLAKCGTCKGFGWLEKDRCHVCRGSGRVEA
jgi:hypothetical protein